MNLLSTMGQTFSRHTWKIITGLAACYLAYKFKGQYASG